MREKTTKDLFDMLIEKQNIDKDTVNKMSYEKAGYFLLEGENIDTGIEERYIIYDCSENKKEFDLTSYLEVMEQEEGIAIPVMIFRNWQQERKKFWGKYDENQIEAKEKRLLSKFFEKKISLYTDLGESIDIEVEDEGINYLEYSTDDCNGLNFLEGYIYNLSFFELKKLFNVTGSDLFKKNVRRGLKKNPTGEGIKQKFKDYINVYIYQGLINNFGLDIEEDQIEMFKELFGIYDELLTMSNPNNFWFYHNGITIFSYDTGCLNRSGRKVQLNPKKVSVINGAQTMTNFYSELESIGRTLPKLLEEYNIDNNTIDTLLEEASKYIKVKTIIIQGPEKFVRSITYGLNTQIPILEEHIIADSEEVGKINEYLQKKGMKILKMGEESPLGNGFTVLEFVKKFLIIDDQPGKSKNLRKSEIRRLIKDAIKNFDLHEEKMLKKFKMLQFLDEWWLETKKQREEIYTSLTEEAFNHYGKNYFGSYLVREDRQELETEYIFFLFDKFIQDMAKINNNPKLGDFKNDELFNQYIETNKIEETFDLSIIPFIDCKELKEYLVKRNASKYALTKAVSDYLKITNITLSYFRVINRVNKRCKEAFPFPNTTFSEIYLHNNLNENDEANYKEFSDSCWAKEITKKYPVFVIERKVIDEMNNADEIVEISLIKNFTFEKYFEDAKKVYQNTIQAFKVGDETLFPKISENLKFHVRPKAINADDTFEFSNGNQITKRTFWANKDTVDTIIEKWLIKEE